MDYLGFLGKEEKSAIKESESRLGYYMDLFKHDRAIELFRFTRCEFEEGLYGYDGDVEIFLPVDELIVGRKDKQSYVTFSNLDRVYNLKIIDIDESKKKVTVSFFKAQEVFRVEEEKKIDAELAAGRHPVVKGTVKALLRDDYGHRNAALIDLLGLGIYGTLKCAEWSVFFTPDLTDVVKVGDVIEVAVIDKTKLSKMSAYSVSRKECADDRMDEFIEKFPVGSGVTVKCIMRKQHVFYGQIVGYERAFCMCYYPRERKIEVGKLYAGFVKSAEPGRSIKVSIGSEL